MKTVSAKKSILKSVTLLAAIGVFAAFSSAKADTLYPGDNGFETPEVSTPTTANGFLQDPATTTTDPWEYDFYYNPVYPDGSGLSGNTGITANGEGFGSAETTNGNSDGTMSDLGQAAFLQGDQAIAQAVPGFETGLTTITFSIESRASDATNPQDGSTVDPVSVYIVPTTEVSTESDYMLLGTFTPASASSFNTVTTTPVFLTAGNYLIDFQGTAQNGLSSFLDNVSIQTGLPVPTPEPSVVYLGAMGMILLVVLRFRRTSKVS